MPKFYLQNQVCGQQTYTTFRQVATLKTTHHIHMWHSVKAAVNLKPPFLNAFITRTIILGQKLTTFRRGYLPQSSDGKGREGTNSGRPPTKRQSSSHTELAFITGSGTDTSSF